MRFLESVSLQEGAGYDVHTPVRAVFRPDPGAVFQRLRSVEPFSVPADRTVAQWRAIITRHAQDTFGDRHQGMVQALARQDTD
eukprot:9862063-Alexandrium_andersonii.AAC.1